MSFAVKGLDELSKTLTDAETALGEIDGTLGQLSFDPHDPASIEGAIIEMERLIDERVSRYASNPIVANLVDQMKAEYRQAIVDKAAEARAAEGSADG